MSEEIVLNGKTYVLKSENATANGHAKASAPFGENVKTLQQAIQWNIEHGYQVDEDALNSGTKDEQAYKKLKVITRAINNGWKPDYTDSDQYKYHPWAEVEADENRKSGFGFSAANCDYWNTNADLGSRLCSPSSNLALHNIRQFNSLWVDYLTGD